MSRAEDIFQKLIYFGEDAIDDFIVNLQTEELFLDFKQAVSTGKNGTSLHKDDRKNLAKGISGFGNSEGGGPRSDRHSHRHAPPAFQGCGTAQSRPSHP